MTVPELRQFQEGLEWRRRRDMGAFALAMTMLLNRIPVFSEDAEAVKFDDLERWISGYMPSEEE